MIWDAKTGAEVQTLRGHTHDVMDLAWRPDGGLLASASDDGTIGIWDAVSWKHKRMLIGHDQRVLGVAWSTDGHWLASCGGDGAIRVWDTEQWGERAVVDGHYGGVNSVTWGPDQETVISAGFDRTVSVWSFEPIAETASLEGHFFAVLCVACSSRGDVASSSRDSTIRLWDLRTGKELRTLEAHTSWVTSVAFSKDGHFLASKSRDGTVRLWRCGAWDSVVLPEQPSPGSVGGVAFSPDGTALATLGEKDTVVRIWDLDFDVLFREPGVTSPVHYTNAKVVLVGETSTGKTCLARALMGEDFQPQESTHGMKVWNFHSETVPRDDGGKITRETLLWDLAGQVDYQVVHQLFLDETVLGVVMFDPTHPENPFGGVGHWEKALTRVAGEDCPRLLVAGRVDRGHPTATAADIEAFQKRHGYQTFIATSAKTGEGVEDMREAIRQAIPWTQLPVTTSPQLWKQIRAYLLKRRQGRSVLTTRQNLKKDFRRKHKGVEFTDPDFDTVVGHAQAQGLVWRLSYGDLVLMKPELLNDYAAAIVRAARKHPRGLGSVAERDVLEAKIDFEDLKRLSGDTEEKLLHAVVQLFLDRELGLRGGPNDEHLVFPSKFNRKLPGIPSPPIREVAYKFAGPVEDIYATLAVRLFYSEPFQLKDLWKNAAEFRDAAGYICGFELTESEEGEGVMAAFFQQGTSVDSKVLFLRFIHEHLQQRAVAGSVVRERIYRCTDCGKEAKDREAINFRLEEGRPTISCQFCDEAIELADVLEAEFGDPELLKRVRELEENVAVKKSQAVGVTVAGGKESVGEFDVFLAHNSVDKPLVEQIAQSLRKRGLNPWLDKYEIPPGRWFQEVIQKAILDVKSAAIILGQTGLGRWQVVELRSFISQCVDREIPIIPVLLPGVTKLPEELVFLKEFSWVKFEKAIDEVEALDNLQWGITEKHPRDRIG